MQHRLVEFYAGRQPDTRGRYLREILAWPDDTLESTHDFIQWLFPTREPSAYNPDAPVMSDDIVAAFERDAALRGTMLNAFDRMLAFYGLERDERSGTTTVRRAANWNRRKRNWLTAGNHNHLRLTRILSSLRVLGCRQEATALRDCLVDISETDGRGAISRETVGYWLRTAQ